MTKKYRSGGPDKYVLKDFADENKNTTQGGTSKEITTEKAFEAFGAGLKKDGEMREAYKLNIAMIIFDTLSASDITENLHDVSNKAADAVLKLFTGDEDE